MRIAEIAERALALLGLVAVSPVLVAAAAAIVLEDGRPILFRQRRVGRHGSHFFVLKLRSMRRRSEGLKITAGEDPRITRTGRLLRKFKLDEFPQLWNVARGEMSFVGPRPEVPEYVDLRDPMWCRVLAERPGISDLASLVFRNEQDLLSQVDDPDSFYRNHLLPRKLKLSLHYNSGRTLFRDIRLVALTLRYSLLSTEVDSRRLLSAFAYTEVTEWSSCLTTNPTSGTTK
jgi:lipopolysaccharide/colanic/teichoic acid biosynthesis glycosyltransferase